MVHVSHVEMRVLGNDTVGVPPASFICDEPRLFCFRERMLNHWYEYTTGQR
jgi:hypothetical protein